MYRDIVMLRQPVKHLVVSVVAVMFLSRPSASLEAQQISEQQILESVYTKEQAERGGIAFKKNCQNCHVPRDYGKLIQQSPDSKNQISGYYDLIRQTMPQDAPGSLSADIYLYLMAYILSLNQFPTTEVPDTSNNQSSVNDPREHSDRVLDRN